MKEELQYDDMFEQFAAEAMQEQIEQTVSRLPVQCRDIFRRSRYEGKSHQEIAQEMNISVRTVETQIYRALKILKKKLKIEN
jgi:RNA polymerase sigma-70 factor (ECF subfamily)